MPIIRSLSTAVASSGLPLERGGSSAVGRGRSGCGESELRLNSQKKHIYIYIYIYSFYQQMYTTVIRFKIIILKSLNSHMFRTLLFHHQEVH